MVKIIHMSSITTRGRSERQVTLCKLWKSRRGPAVVVAALHICVKAHWFCLSGYLVAGGILVGRYNITTTVTASLLIIVNAVIITIKNSFKVR